MLFMGAVLYEIVLRRRFNCYVDIWFVISFLPWDNDGCAFFLHPDHVPVRL